MNARIQSRANICILRRGGVATVTASCVPTRGVSERNSGEEGTNSGPDAAGADMARLTAGLHWNGPAVHVGFPPGC